MSSSICVPGPVIVPFTQPDPPRAEPIQAAVNILVRGFELHRGSINCTNDRIDAIITGGASVLARLDGGSTLGPGAIFNFITGANIQLALALVGTQFNLTISAPNVVTAGANVGVGGGGVGQIFRDKTGTTLNFRSINPLSPLLGLTLGDQVLLAVVTSPGGASEVVGSNRVIAGTSPILINGGTSSNLQSNITISYQFDPRTKMEYWEDFIGLATFGGWSTVQNGWQPIVSGVGCAFNGIGGETSHPGIVRLTLTAGDFNVGDHVVYITADTGGVEHINWEAGYNVAFAGRLSYSTENVTNGNNIITRIGLGDEFANGDFTNGVYFEYDPQTTQNWKRCTANAGARTKVDTGVVATNLFVPMRFEANGASAVEFFLDGNSVGINSSNVPGGQIITPQAQMVADISNITASQLIAFDVDYFWMENTQITR